MKYIKQMNPQELKELERRLGVLCGGKVTIIPSDTDQPTQVICPADIITKDQIWAAIKSYGEEI